MSSDYPGMPATAYRYYRINVTANNGDITFIHLGDVGLWSDTIVSIVQRWARQSPAALGCVNQFPDGNLRDTAMECLAQAVVGRK